MQAFVLLGLLGPQKGKHFLQTFNPDYMLQHISDLLQFVKGEKGVRRTESYPSKGGANSLWHIYKTVPFFKVAKNFAVIQLSRYTPFMPMKNFLFRTFLKMEVGNKTSFALMVMPDVMFPGADKSRRQLNHWL